MHVIVLHLEFAVADRWTLDLSWTRQGALVEETGQEWKASPKI